MRGDVVERVARRCAQFLRDRRIEQHRVGGHADRHPVRCPLPQQSADIGQLTRPRSGVLAGTDEPAQRALLLTRQFGQLRCLAADLPPAPGHQREHLDGTVVHLTGQPLPLLDRRRQPGRALQFGVGATRRLRGHTDREADRKFDDDCRVAAEVELNIPLSTALAATSPRTPVSMPPIGPNRMAAEIVAFVAHSVVGQD